MILYDEWTVMENGLEFVKKIWIFAIFKIVNKQAFIVFQLMMRNEEKLNYENRTDAKTSSQGIQQDRFHQFWTSVQEVMDFRTIMEKNID